MEKHRHQKRGHETTRKSLFFLFWATLAEVKTFEDNFSAAKKTDERKMDIILQKSWFRHFSGGPKMSADLAISRVDKRAGQELTSGPVNSGLFFDHVLLDRLLALRRPGY